MTDQSVPEQIRATVETSDYPELSVREVVQRTGLSEQQVYSAAGSMDRLELDRRVGVVRLPEDDGGEFVDDPEYELLTDGGVDQDDEGDHQCGYCGATALAYQLESGKGPVVRCIPCLAIEQGSQKLGQPFEVFVDFSPSVVYDSEEEKRESQKNSYEVARSWYTVLGRIQQDEPIIKRDPDDFGTVHEWTREFLTNIMGADAHKRPSEGVGSKVSIGQTTLSGGDDGEPDTGEPVDTTQITDEAAIDELGGGESMDKIDEDDLFTDGGADQAVGKKEHPLMLCKRWSDEAEANIEKWGNQRHDTLLLALIEEVGEIAIAMGANSETIYDATPPDADDVPAAVGRELISDMAALGRETRDFLEGEYGDPASDGDSPDEHRIHDEPTDATRILEEVEDTAPLCFQLYWALQGVDGGE